MTIKFGTDGWRAVISDTFTFANLRLVAQAIADYVLEEADDVQPAVVVGFDTRFLSDRYAAEVARVLAGNGIVSYLARADAPVVVGQHIIRVEPDCRVKIRERLFVTPQVSQRAAGSL